MRLCGGGKLCWDRGIPPLANLLGKNSCGCGCDSDAVCRHHPTSPLTPGCADETRQSIRAGEERGIGTEASGVSRCLYRPASQYLTKASPAETTDSWVVPRAPLRSGLGQRRRQAARCCGPHHSGQDQAPASAELLGVAARNTLTRTRQRRRPSCWVLRPATLRPGPGTGVSRAVGYTGRTTSLYRKLHLFSSYIEATTNPLPSGYGFLAAPPATELQHGREPPPRKEKPHHG